MRLYHFRPSEFDRNGVNWYARMDPRLLVLLDVFRHQWGPVRISPHHHALGRKRWPNQNSDHYVDEDMTTVYAADVLPAGMTRHADAKRAITLAEQCAFTSIGLYPHWWPSPGLHLGTRPGRQPGNPATWGAIRPERDDPQAYVSLSAALELMP
jgi:hypothetical protein